MAGRVFLSLNPSAQTRPGLCCGRNESRSFLDHGVGPHAGICLRDRRRKKRTGWVTGSRTDQVLLVMTASFVQRKQKIPACLFVFGGPTSS